MWLDATASAAAIAGEADRGGVDREDGRPRTHAAGARLDAAVRMELGHFPALVNADTLLEEHPPETEREPRGWTVAFSR